MGTETDYLTGFYFKLMPIPPLQGSHTEAGFKEISGLTMTTNVEEVTGGGQNWFKYKLPQAVTYSNLELKRGVANVASPLFKWLETTMSGGLMLPVVTLDLCVILMDPTGSPNMVWTIVGAYPVKWSGAELNSDKNEVFIESMELAYKYFVVARTLPNQNQSSQATNTGG